MSVVSFDELLQLALSSLQSKSTQMRNFILPAGILAVGIRHVILNLFLFLLFIFILCLLLCVSELFKESAMSIFSSLFLKFRLNILGK
jgi:hypothetical protein